MEFPDWHFDNHGNEIFLIWKKKLKEKGTIVTQEHLREFERTYRVLTIAAEQAHPAQQFLKRWFIETTLWKQFMDDPELEKFPWTAPKSMTPKEAAEVHAAESKRAKASAKNTKAGTPAVSTTPKPNDTAMKQNSASSKVKVASRAQNLSPVVAAKPPAPAPPSPPPAEQTPKTEWKSWLGKRNEKLRMSKAYDPEQKQRLILKPTAEGLPMFCVLNTHADAAMAWRGKYSAHVREVESFLSVILSSFEIGRKFYVYPEPPCPGDLNDWSAKRILWSWEFLDRWSRSTITRRPGNRKYQAAVPLDKFLELHLRDNPLSMDGMLFPGTEFDLPQVVTPLELKDVGTAAMALKTTKSPSSGETNKSTCQSAKADALPVSDEEVPVAGIFDIEGKFLSEICYDILNEGLWSLLQEFKNPRWVSPDIILELTDPEVRAILSIDWYAREVRLLRPLWSNAQLQDEAKRLRTLDWKSAGLDNVRLIVLAVAVIAIKHIDKAVAKIEEEGENSA
ncbi:hypothetical protein BKA61DRAFT_577686 [Leptodontidium sp. MPI-SDFR-AT-0119]|nr:hypothetical protein BKA61DRAFT_577686 [Leptodontidium sp. MPI-SDFR-AT-0119]